MPLTRVGSHPTQAVLNAPMDQIERIGSRVNGRGVIEGLTLTAGTGLNVSVAAGWIAADVIAQIGPLTVPVPASATRWIWADPAGATVLTTTSADPGGLWVCLGNVTTSASAVTGVEAVGRMVLPRMVAAREWRAGNLRVNLDGGVNFNGGTPVVPTVVAAPAVLTAAATASASYSQVEVQRMRDDIAALRQTVADLRATLALLGLA